MVPRSKIMNKRTKQMISGITLNVLVILFAFYLYINRNNDITWKTIFLFLSLFIIVALIFRLVWGPNAFFVAWRDEGYSSFFKWYRESRTLNAKLFRFLLIALLAIAIVFAISIAIVAKQS
jgi:hypothetical protein